MTQDKQVIGLSQFGIGSLNDANTTLSSIEGKKLTSAEIIAAAEAQARIAQAAGVLALTETLGNLTQVMQKRPGVSSDGLAYIVREATKAFAPQDTDPFVTYGECWSGQNKAHLPHRWRLDENTVRYCEGKTPAQLAEENDR